MGLGQLLIRTGRGRQAGGSGQHERAAGATFQVIIDGQPINYPMSLYHGGMALPGAWRASLMISDALGSVPWDAYREVDGRPVELISPRPILLDKPAADDERMTTFSSWGLDLVWHGNAVALIAARDRDGVPSVVLPIPAEYVGVRRVGWEAKSRLPVGPIEYQVGGLTFGPERVLHIKGPCPPGEVRGFGVLEAHLTGMSGKDGGTLDLARELQRQAQAISQHGVPTGVISAENPDLTPDEAKEMKATWLASQRDRTVAVLKAAKFEPLSWNPTELQLVEGRKMSLLETALLFGVQPSALGVETSNRTYRNDNAEDVKFAKWGLRGHIARFEAALSGIMPPGQCVRADLDDYVRADILTRYQAHGLSTGNRPWRTVNEVRRAEGLPELPGGDELPEPTAAPPGPSVPAIEAGGNEPDEPEIDEETSNGDDQDDQQEG